MDDETSGESRLNFQTIVLKHIDRCVKNMSVEFHGGFWQESGNPLQKIYVFDTRETFSNSVKTLRVLLLPFFDKKMKEEDKKLKEIFTTNEKKQNKERSDEEKYSWMDYTTKWHTNLFEQLVMLVKRLNFCMEGY